MKTGLIVALMTLLVLLLCSFGMGSMSMVLANGFMSHTDEMAWSYLACNGVSVLALTALSAGLTQFLQRRFQLNPWLGGLFSLGLAMLLFGCAMFLAFFAIVTIFGS